MTDETRRLIAAAKADPTEDAPREALADHLAAIGDADRAEFLRHQLKNVDTTVWYPGESEARAREDTLRKRHQRAWTGNGYGGAYWFDYADRQRDYMWDDENSPDVARGKFERGFFRVDGSVAECRAAFDRLTADQAAWLERLEIGSVSSATDLMSVIDSPHGRQATAVDVLQEDVPEAALDPLDRDTLRAVRFDFGPTQRRVAEFRSLRPHALSASVDENDPDALGVLFGSPLMANVRDLGCSAEDATDAVAALAESDCRLTRLVLSGNGFTSKQLRDLFDSPVLREVRLLTVGGTDDNQSGLVAELVKSTVVRNVVELDLGSNRVTSSEMRAFAAWPGLETIRRLKLGSADVPDAGIVALAGSPLAANLDELEVFGEKLSDDAAVAIARSPHLKGLRRLSLCKVSMSGRSIRAIAASETLANLEELDISLAPLPPDAVGILAASKTFGGLKKLALRQLRMDNTAFAALMNSPVLASVESLDLQGAQLNGPKLKALVESPRLDSLRELILGDNGLPPGGIDAVFSAGWVRNLRALTVYENGVTDAGVRALVAAVTGDRLTALDLNDNALTDAAADALLAWPGLKHLTDLSLYPNPMGQERMNEVARASREG